MRVSYRRNGFGIDSKHQGEVIIYLMNALERSALGLGHIGRHDGNGGERDAAEEEVDA